MRFTPCFLSAYASIWLVFRCVLNLVRFLDLFRIWLAFWYVLIFVVLYIYFIAMRFDLASFFGCALIFFVL